MPKCGIVCCFLLKVLICKVELGRGRERGRDRERVSANSFPKWL